MQRLSVHSVGMQRMTLAILLSAASVFAGEHGVDAWSAAIARRRFDPAPDHPQDCRSTASFDLRLVL